MRIDCNSNTENNITQYCRKLNAYSALAHCYEESFITVLSLPCSAIPGDYYSTECNECQK